MTATTTPSAAFGQYGPDPEGVPDSFLCGWRMLVYNASIERRPDAARIVRDALQLPKYCNETPIPDPNRSSVPPSQPSEGLPTVHVSLRGKDSWPGTAAKPKRTIQAGVDATTGMKGRKRVLLESGTYYLSEPVKLKGGLHDFLTVEAASLDAKDRTWLSGGIMLHTPVWTRVGNKESRVWKTDLSRYNLDDVASLRVDGRRVNPSRYPNANPEVEFWPKGYATSTSKWIDDGGDWRRPTIAPSPNPAFPVNVTGRPFDMYFRNYTGGINGTCAIYDPPFSFWCSSPPFSTGCGGCFTWNIPSGLETRNVLTSRPGWPFAQPEEMQVMAWRAAHWANCK